MDARKNSRLENIDALRGVCVLFVLFTHLAIAPWFVGRVGVAAFFLVSGYVIPFSLMANAGAKSVFYFWIKRFFRLWPAYWVSIFLAVILITPTVVELSQSDILLNITMLQGFLGKANVIPVYWTLQIELCFYFMISTLLFFAKSQDEKYCLIISIIFSVLALTMAVIRYYAGIKFPVAIPVAMSLMFFSALCRVRRINGQGLPIYLCAFILVLLIPTCTFAYADVHKPGESFGYYILAYFSAFALFLFFEKMATAPKFIVFLGTISYSFYLLHELVIFTTENYFPEINIFLKVLVTFSVTCMISWLCYFIIENPAQRLGKQVLNAIRSRSALVTPRAGVAANDIGISGKP